MGSVAVRKSVWDVLFSVQWSLQCCTGMARMQLSKISQFMSLPLVSACELKLLCLYAFCNMIASGVLCSGSSRYIVHVSMFPNRMVCHFHTLSPLSSWLYGSALQNYPLQIGSNHQISFPFSGVWSCFNIALFMFVCVDAARMMFLLVVICVSVLYYRQPDRTLTRSWRGRS